MTRTLGTVLALILALPSLAEATLLQQARFLLLNPDAGSLESPPRDYQHGDIRVTGERILLENGRLEASALAIEHPRAEVAQLAVHTALALDAAFFRDPVKAVIEAVLARSGVTIGTLRLKPDPTESVSLTATSLAIEQKQFQFATRVLLVRFGATGKLEHQPEDHRLVAELTSVRAAGLPVPLKVAFFAMSRLVRVPFITFESPRILIDLGYFLPPHP